MESNGQSNTPVKKSLARRLLFLLAVPKCVACNTPLQEGDRALCRSCLAEYYDSKERTCSLCARPLYRCRCTVKMLENNTVHTLVKVYRYRPQIEELPSNYLIFAAKCKNRRDVCNFLVGEIADAVHAALPDLSDFSVTYVPRRPANVRKFGYDHAKDLSVALAEKLGLPHFCALRSCVRRDQKEMTVIQRTKNAVFRLRRKFRVGKTAVTKKVLIFDDIVTSGASMSACARLLRRCGARTIVGVVIAAAYRDQDAVRHGFRAGAKFSTRKRVSPKKKKEGSPLEKSDEIHL